MRVLLLHNRYRKAGGEDAAFESEQQLLTWRGHDVRTVFASNDTQGTLASLAMVCDSSWSRHSFEYVQNLCRELRPDIVHVHNFWMSWTPSVHAACRQEGVATVQTLHNFRLFCVNGVCLRDGQPCRDCLGRSPWLGVTRRCYRDSVFASASAARMISMNRLRETWRTDVNAFIVPGQHARSLYLEAGFPAHRTFVKPNLVRDPGVSQRRPSESSWLAYIGRLSPEKGIAVLFDAWKQARRPPDSRLLIIGEEQVAGFYSRNAPPDVLFCGAVERERIPTMLDSVRAIVAPSLCYETFGMSVVEAFASGRSAIVADIGALAELVDHGRTGLKCAPGSAASLAAQIESILSPGTLSDTLGASARSEYLRRYSSESNYQQLMRIYDFALTSANARTAAALGAAV